IDSIEQENDDSLWIIKLTLHNQTSKYIEKLINDFNEYRNRFHNFHHLFMKTDDFRLINIYYYLLTNNTFALNNNSNVIMYIHLAFFFSNLGLYEKAIQL